MILTIDLNPVLEKTYYMEKLLPKVETEAEKAIYKSGGPGINCAQALNKFNLDAYSIGFLGGLSGKYIINNLRNQGINCNFIQIKDGTKTSISLVENNMFLSKITEPSPRVTREELGSFYELYKNTISDCDIVCGLGSLPTGTPEEIYFDLISLSNSMNKAFLLETTGLELKYGIEAKPYMVKLNLHELENLTHLKLNFENEIIKAANYILEKGIELVVIDLNEKGSIVLNKDRGYRLELNNLPDKLLNTDSGYMLAGYALGVDKDYDMEVTMKLGQAFRVAYGLAENINDIDMSDIKRIMGNITIMPIYY